MSPPTLEQEPAVPTGASRRVRSKTIGVLSLEPTPPSRALTVLGIRAAARESDCYLSMVTLPVCRRRMLLGAVERLRGAGVDGILVVAPPPAAMPTLTDVCAEIPLVLIGAPAQASVSAVTSDHYSGAAAATRHLLELGHRSVVHIAASADRAGTGSRLAGWRDTLRAAGVDIRAPVAGDGTAETGYALGRRLAARPEVTAIFVADDQMAVGVLRALSEARRRVPADVSLVGFGGMPEGEFFSPPLTTVAEDFAELGRRGVELLEAAIAGGDAVPVHETLPTALIVRASTAPVA